jgi:hypothetical protein
VLVDLGVSKVDVPNSVTNLNKTLTFEWCVVRCGPKTNMKEDTGLEEIGLHAQNMITILGSLHNIIRGAYMIIQRTRESSH